MFTALFAIILSFVLAYTGTHYTLATWQVKPNFCIVAGVVVGLFVAFIATVTVSPVVGL